MLGKVTTQAYQNARMDKRQKMVRYTDLCTFFLSFFLSLSSPFPFRCCSPLTAFLSFHTFPPTAPFSPPSASPTRPVSLPPFLHLSPSLPPPPSSSAAAIHTHPAWFYLGEVIPSAMPLSAALALRQANEDLASKPSAVTTAAPAKKFDGKRVVKNKGGKGAKVAPVGGLPQTAAGGWEGEGVGGELGKRKTRGKKLKLPVGEGGEGSEGSEFGGSDGAEGDDAYDDAAMEV